MVQEFNSYLTPEPVSNMVVDRSPIGDLLRINFNVSFPALSCEYATLDVSDAIGLVSSSGWGRLGAHDLSGLVGGCAATPLSGKQPA